MSETEAEWTETAEPTPLVTQAAAVTEQTSQPAEQGQTHEPAAASSPSEIEQKLAELAAHLRREHQEEVASLRADLEAERRSRKQAVQDSSASILARLQEQYGNQTQVIDELERDGLLTTDEADRRRNAVRNRLERDEVQRHREPATLSRPPFVESERQRVIATCSDLLQKSGLIDTDPELKSVPLRIDARVKPDDAIRMFTQALNKATTDKQARVKREHDEKEKQDKAKLASAQTNAVRVDLGGGGGVATHDPQKELEEMVAKGPPDSGAAEINKYYNRLKTLRAEAARRGGGA